MIKNTKGFSMIEILIGIFIFSLGLVSVYALIVTTLNLNEYSKNSIIATNLARESTELIRNVRDNNYTHLYKWNKLPGNDTSRVFSTGVYYKVENNYTSFSNDDISMSEIPNFVEGKSYLSSMGNYQLCLDSNNLYTYDCSNQNTKTYFYRYLKFDDVVYNSGGVNIKVDNALKVTSKVIWYSKGYHDIELKTILTDYLRQ